MTTKLNNENLILYAAKNYDNPSCESLDEFYDDFKRIKYVKKLFKKYIESGDLRERLVLNHMISLHNVFGTEPTAKMLFLKLRDYWPQTKTFLVFLNQMPEVIELDDITVYNSNIPLDNFIVDRLRGI